MTENFTAFDLSPVPAPGPDAVSPGVSRAIYGMPMFVTLPSADLEASRRYWIDVLGFVDLFSVPGQLTHLRRWAFQDVLLVPGDPEPAGGRSVSFACVLGEIDELARRTDVEPQHTPWNTVDLEVVTPEGARVVMTAAKPFDPASAEAQNLAEIGIAP
jgi:catechol 2,3-dioxygenase-like lactoylglutathione lyase family enzyme